MFTYVAGDLLIVKSLDLSCIYIFRPTACGDTIQKKADGMRVV